VTVAAKVRDAETAPEQLQYTWTAAVGTIAGSGATVTWTAPAPVPGPSEVILTLTVTERYGAGNALEQSVTSTARVAVHDSAREVGGMARQFLLDFSDSTIRDVPYIMRNFSKARCPQPGEVDAEYVDVADNRIKLRIVGSRVDAPTVSVNFSGTCPVFGKRGDACAVVPVFWDSIDLQTNVRGITQGNDIIAAVYAAADARWWLCASNYQSFDAFAARFR
jgi:hypothetical protein